MSQVLGGRYEVQRQLGRQTGRQTLLALDLQTGEQVVVKQLLLGSDFDWQDLKLFEREAATLRSLSHPAIPRYLDYLELDLPEGKGFALVQSYVEGRSLEEHLKAGRTFSQSDVRTIARSLLEILVYLHSQDPPVIHRDIKPSNVLLSDRSGNHPGQIYLVDFGSVQNLIAREGGTITVVGTYGYMPPEQFGGRVTPASDLYSLGATLIFLITGRHPTELPQQNFQIQFRRVVNLKSSLADWLEWLTQPALDRRVASAEAALQALDNPALIPRAPLPAPVASPVRQPHNSTVLLTRTPRVLQICTARESFQFLALSVITVGGLFFCWAVLGTLCGFGASMPLPLNLMTLTGLVIAAIALLPVFRRVQLTIDSDQITFVNELFGFKWPRTPAAARPAISRLCLTYRTYRNVRGESVRAIVQLTIWAGNQAFVLDDRLFTSEELHWLAYQLSAWLELPITEV